MTEDEIATMKCMWDAGYSGKAIARKLSYSVSNVFVTMMRNRDMFPKRNVTIDRDERERWVARILAGRVTPHQVARKTGVSKTTVYNWLREAKKKEDK